MKRIIIGILIFFTLVSGKAQDAQFSQFYSAPLYLGPSFAGAANSGRVIINFRDQWPQLNSSFISYAFSADYYFDEYNSGVGFLLFRDQAGDGGLVNTTNAALLYSYNFSLNQTWSIRPGFSAYYYTKAINIANLRFGDEIIRGVGGGSSVDMTALSNLEPINHFDFSSSVLAYSNKYWIGFTLDHIMYFSNILASTGDYLPFRYSIYAGGKYMITGKTRKVLEESLTFALNFMAQERINYLDLGAYYTNEPFIIGLWYRGLPVFPKNRTVGALAVSLGYKYKAMRIGYSYDFTLTRLVTQTGGAHEVSLSYVFAERKKRRVKHKMVPCPVL